MNYFRQEECNKARLASLGKVIYNIVIVVYERKASQVISLVFFVVIGIV